MTLKINMSVQGLCSRRPHHLIMSENVDTSTSSICEFVGIVCQSVRTRSLTAVATVLQFVPSEGQKHRYSSVCNIYDTLFL